MVCTKPILIDGPDPPNCKAMSESRQLVSTFVYVNCYETKRVMECHPLFVK